MIIQVEKQGILCTNGLTGIEGMKKHIGVSAERGLSVG
jgi:hypothetical protein